MVYAKGIRRPIFVRCLNSRRFKGLSLCFDVPFYGLVHATCRCGSKFILKRSFYEKMGVIDFSDIVRCEYGFS